MLRFDGIYSCIKDNNNSLIRFYEDGLVISQTIGGNESGCLSNLFPSGNWFGRGHDNSGMYEVYDDSIKFSCCSAYGQVDYVGTIIGESLFLNSYSHINGNKSSRRYVFFSDNVINAIKTK